jgi:hypothetical protein
MQQFSGMALRGGSRRAQEAVRSRVGITGSPQQPVLFVVRQNERPVDLLLNDRDRRGKTLLISKPLTRNVNRKLFFIAAYHRFQIVCEVDFATIEKKASMHPALLDMQLQRGVGDLLL